MIMKVLKLEYLKMVNYRPFVILLSIYFILLILIGLYSPNISIEIQNNNIDLEKLGAYNFPVFWQFAAWFALLLKLFLGILVIFNVANEFDFKTIKQNLIDGLSKYEFFGSKVIGSMIFAILSSLVLAGIVIILGSIFSNSEEAFYKGIQFLGYYCLHLMAFFAILIFLTILVKRSVIAILLTVIWWIIESVLNLIETTLRAIKQVDGDHVEIDESNIENMVLITDYLPMNAISNLVQFPKVELLNFMQGLPVFITRPTHYSFIIVSVAYLFIFLYLGYWRFKKRDL